MKKKKLISGALALTLLTGCSGSTTAAPVADALQKFFKTFTERDGGTTAPAADDLLYQAADIRRDSQLLTVDGVGVNAEEYFYMLMNGISQEMYYNGMSTSDDWSAVGADGQSTSEYLKADALEGMIVYQVVRNHAAELGVELSEERKAEIREELDAAIISRYGSEEDFQNYLLDELCISKDGFVALNEVAYLSEALEEKLREDGTIAASEEATEKFLQEQGIYGAKHILVATRDISEDKSFREFTDEEKAQALANANELRQQLRNAGDSEEKFDELMAEYSEDGRDENGDLYSPEGYTYVYPGQMVTTFEAGAKALAVGEISEPIESPYGYHIILRIAPDQEQAESDSLAYQYYDLTQQWSADAEVVTTTAYDELDVQAFYDRLQEILDAREEARSAAKESAEPEESPTESGEPETTPAN